jgi:hypothetical protein
MTNIRDKKERGGGRALLKSYGRGSASFEPLVNVYKRVFWLFIQAWRADGII